MRRLLFAALVLNIAPAIGGDIHSWTDERGVRHFSDRPTDFNRTHSYALPTAPSPGPRQDRADNPAQRAAADQRRFEATLRQDAAREKQARLQRCQKLKEHLSLLEQHTRLRTSDSAGKPRPLSEPERQLLISDTQERLRVTCLM